MGIKFNCPHCSQKLNIKSELSGKKGVCPHCGSKIRIPATDSPEPSAGSFPEKEAAPAPSGPSTAVATQPAANTAMQVSSGAWTVKSAAPSAPQPASSTVQPATAPVAGVAVQPHLPAPAGQVAAAQGTIQPMAAAPQVPAAMPSGMQPALAAQPFTGPVTAAGAVSPPSVSGDPITENPRAVWYVRPSGGGQFGPAPGEMMRSWLREGRVGPDSMVWREGWPEWQRATVVFPTQFAGSAAGVQTAYGQPAAAQPAFAAPAAMGAMPGAGYPQAGFAAPASAAPYGAPGAVGAAPMVGVAQPAPAAAAGQRPPARRRKSNALSLAFIIVLTIAVLALIPVLIYVVQHQPTAPSEEGDTTPATTTAPAEENPEPDPAGEAEDSADDNAEDDAPDSDR